MYYYSRAKMPLHYLKSLTECETKNKSRNGNTKEKMFYTEIYDVSSCQSNRHASNRDKKISQTELLRAILPELLNDTLSRDVKNKKSNILKIKSTEINPHKHKTSDSSHVTHEITLKQKNENKVSPSLERERPVKRKDFIVKQIPLKNNLLEFSIDRNHCPMVVRVHRGQPNKAKTKQKRQLAHSHSCPPKIDGHLKNNSNNTTQNKQKREKSKQKRKYQGHTICELLNLSPRKASVCSKNNILGIFKDNNTSDVLHKKTILKNRGRPKLQNGGVNEITRDCTECNIRYIKKKYPTNKNTKPHEILVNDRPKCYEQNTISAQLEMEDEYVPDIQKSSNLLNNKIITDKQSSNIKTRAMNVTTEDEELEKECRPTHDHDGEAIQTESYDLADLKTKVLMMQNDEIDNGKIFLQSHAQGEMPHDMETYSQNYNNYYVPRKNPTILHHTSPYAPSSIDPCNNEAQKFSKLKNVPAQETNLLDNVVRLDASQSQFCKISKFLKQSAFSKDRENDNLKLLRKLSVLEQNNNLFFKDQGYNKKETNEEFAHSSVYEKGQEIRTEEKGLNKYCDFNQYKRGKNEQSGSILPQPRGSSLLSGLNTDTHSFKTPENLVNKKIKNKYYSSSYNNCRGCSRVVCKIENFNPYCSDCNLKIKLSQISSDSTSTNSDVELTDRLTTSATALTIIPESDISLSKNLVNVAVQTECGSGNVKQDCGKQNIKPHITKNSNNLSHSLQNMFEMYCSMEAQFNKVQGSPLKMKESLTRRNVNDFLFDEDLFSGDIQRQKQAMQPGDQLCGDTSLSLKHKEPRRSLNRPNSTEPAIHNYGGSMIDSYSQKHNVKTGVNIPVEHQTKSLVPSFVSPIFPEKKYFRIMSNRREPCLAAISSNGEFTNKCVINDPNNNKYSKKCAHKLNNDVYFQSSSDNNNCEPHEQFSIQSIKSSPRKVTKPIIGSYINYEKGVGCYEEINNFNNFKYSPPVNEYKGLSLSKKGASISGDMNILPDISFSAMNMNNSSLSIDNYLRSEKNEVHKASFLLNSISTLPRTTKYQSLNCLSTHKSSIDINDLYLVSNRTQENYKKSQLISKQKSNSSSNEMLKKKIKSTESINCLKQECFLNTGNSKSLPFQKTFDLSMGDIDPKFKFITEPYKVEEAKPEMYLHRGVSISPIISFTDSKVNKKNSTSSKNFKFGTETTDAFNLNSFSYILFNISLKGTENVNSDVEESYEKVFLETDLVLTPEKSVNIYDGNYLSDIILGSKFKTQISRRLMLRKEKDVNNVFELSSISEMPKVIIGEERDLQVCDWEKDNLEDKYLVYKAISSNGKLNEANNAPNMVEIIENPNLKENLVDSSLIETSFEITKEHEKISNILKKHKPKDPKEKTRSTKTSKKCQNKFTKINSLFMAGYMAQLSLFHGLQRKVHYDSRKSKFT